MIGHTISGGGGVKIHVSEHGNPAGKPILLIHGWSQAELCWTKQYQAPELSGFRLLGIDLRGHGMSERPTDQEAYTDGDMWADDIASVIEELDLDRPILVGWSYGGVVIGDYLRRFGAERIGGINLVAAAIVLGSDAFGRLIGPGFLDHAPAACTPDLAENIQAVRALLRRCTAEPLSADDFETCLAFTMVVPPWVRGYLIQREVNFGSTYGAANTRLLLTHGGADTFVLPAMSELILDHCPHAETSWFEGVGHAPFLERPDQFNRELADFAKAD